MKGLYTDNSARRITLPGSNISLGVPSAQSKHVLCLEYYCLIICQERLQTILILPMFISIQAFLIGRFLSKLIVQCLLVAYRILICIIQNRLASKKSSTTVINQSLIYTQIVRSVLNHIGFSIAVWIIAAKTGGPKVKSSINFP